MYWVATWNGETEERRPGRDGLAVLVPWDLWPASRLADYAVGEGVAAIALREYSGIGSGVSARLS